MDLLLSLSLSFSNATAAAPFARNIGSRDTRVAAADTEYDFAQGTREGEQNLTILGEREGREK